MGLTELGLGLGRDRGAVMASLVGVLADEAGLILERLVPTEAPIEGTVGESSVLLDSMATFPSFFPGVVAGFISKVEKSSSFFKNK